MQVLPMSQWIPEYCIVCDKQCPQGSVYCSEKCRCAEEHSDDSCKKQDSQHNINRLSNLTDTSSESSDEDGELNGFMLSHKPQISVGSNNNVAQSQSSKKSVRKDNQFLYASPRLNPQKNPKISPSMSPLLIPSNTLTPEVVNTDQLSVQSVNTYKRWMLSDTE